MPTLRGDDDHETMRQAIQENVVEVRVLGTQLEEARRTNDRRHVENKAALLELQKRATDSVHDLGQLSTKQDNLTVELIGWGYQGGKGGIKADITTLLERTEHLDVLVAQAATAAAEKAVAASIRSRDAGAWRKLITWRNAALGSLVLLIAGFLLTAALSAALHLSGAAH